MNFLLIFHSGCSPENQLYDSIVSHYEYSVMWFLQGILSCLFVVFPVLLESIPVPRFDLFYERSPVLLVCSPVFFDFIRLSLGLKIKRLLIDFIFDFAVLISPFVDP